MPSTTLTTTFVAPLRGHRTWAKSALKSTYVLPIFPPNFDSSRGIFVRSITLFPPALLFVPEDFLVPACFAIGPPRMSSPPRLQVTFSRRRLVSKFVRHSGGVEREA